MHGENEDDADGDIDINQTFAELQQRSPEKVKQVIKEVRGIRSGGPKKTVQNHYKKLQQLLEDEPKLLRLFMKQLEKEDGISARENNAAQNDGTNRSNILTQSDEEDYAGPSKNQINSKLAMKQKPKIAKRGNKRSEQDVGPVSIQPKEVSATSALPPNMRNEVYLFEYLKSNLTNEQYDDLMKIIYLYSEAIIGT